MTIDQSSAFFYGSKALFHKRQDFKIFSVPCGITLNRLLRNIGPTLGHLSDSANGLSGKLERDHHKPDNHFFLMVLVATIAGAMMVIFTSF
jgi:hypothetical protein